MEVTNNNVFVDTKFVDLNALGKFLNNVRTEVSDNYVNASNAVTTEDIDSIFGAAKGNFSVIAGLDDSGDRREFEFETGMTWGEYININNEYFGSTLIYNGQEVISTLYDGGQLVEIMDGDTLVYVLLSDPIKPTTYYTRYSPV